MAHSLRAQSITAGRVQLQEHGSPGHTVSAEEAEREEELYLETLTEVSEPRE